MPVGAVVALVQHHPCIKVWVAMAAAAMVNKIQFQTHNPENQTPAVAVVEIIMPMVLLEVQA
jgi:hypothetical protein